MRILKFGSDWCPACKQMTKMIDSDLKKEYRLLIEEIDVDKDDDLVDKYEIRSLPTLVFDTNKGVYKYNGLISIERIQNLIEKHEKEDIN